MRTGRCRARSAGSACRAECGCARRPECAAPRAAWARRRTSRRRRASGRRPGSRARVQRAELPRFDERLRDSCGACRPTTERGIARRAAAALASHSARGREALEVVERRAAAIARRIEQAEEHVRRGERVAAGAVARTDVRCRNSSSTTSRFRRRSCGTSFRASRTVQSRRPSSGRRVDALDLRGQKAPVERRVVRDEHISLEHAEELIAHVARSAARASPSPT